MTNAANNFAGDVRLDAGTLRVSTGLALGRSVSANAILLNGGTLEVRSDTGTTGFANRNVNIAATAAGTIFVDRAVGGSGLNQSVLFGILTANAGGAQNTTWSISGRNGYGVTFSSFAPGTTLRNNTFSNNSNGLVTFLGDFQNSTENGASAVIQLGGNSETLITGSIKDAQAFAANVTKNGSGRATIQGNASTYLGPTNISAGTLAITNFGALNNAVTVPVRPRTW